MTAPPQWPTHALRFLAPVLLLLLVAQYLLGLWTNLYAPSTGFTSSSSSPSLDWHYNLGYLLGVLGILAIVFAALSRQAPLIGTAVGFFLSVLLAGVAGMAFVRTDANPPLYSLEMGLLFLFAFGAAMGLAVRTWMRPTPSSSVAAPTSSS